MLIEHGAYKEAADSDGRTSLIEACYDEQLEMVACLLQQGCDVDRADFLGCTPLHWAAKTNHMNVARILLFFGAKFDVRDSFGRTPADLSTIRNGHMYCLINDSMRAEKIRQQFWGFKYFCWLTRGREQNIPIDPALHILDYAGYANFHTQYKISFEALREVTVGAVWGDY